MNWSTFVTLSVSSAAFHWILARSTIMKWFWGASWLPRRIRELLECPACSGFWLGLYLGVVGIQPITTHSWLVNVLFTGVLALFGTPVAEGILLWGLERSRVPPSA